MAIIIYCYLSKIFCFKKNEDNANPNIENNNPNNNGNIDSKNITLITNVDNNQKKEDNNEDDNGSHSKSENIEKDEKEDGSSIHP